MSEPGFPIEAVYDDSKLTDFRPEGPVSEPVTWPVHRGVYSQHYDEWSSTVRQFAESAPATQAERRDPIAANDNAISALKSAKSAKVSDRLPNGSG